MMITGPPPKFNGTRDNLAASPLPQAAPGCPHPAIPQVNYQAPLI